MQWLTARKALVVLLVAITLFNALPFLEIAHEVGTHWRGILPVFLDELYFARVHTIALGHFTSGNPYYYEHADGPPLVLFAGAWLNVLPLLAGVPYNLSFALNLAIWGILFGISLYALLRELKLSPWYAALGTFLMYVQSFGHVWRPVNLQPVMPFYFLFYLALLRFIRDRSRNNKILLGVSLGVLFYLFAYMWQVGVTTVGLLVLYAMVKRNWLLFKDSVQVLIGGCLIGSPVPLYMLWLSHHSPYFWQSMGRLGLVETHIPMAEVIYSGGWIVLACAFVGLLAWKTRWFNHDTWFTSLTAFVITSGMGLWIIQGSNLLTGKQLETGEHIRVLLVPWLAFTTLALITYLWQHRRELGGYMRTLSVGTVVLLVGASLYFSYLSFLPFLHPSQNQKLWLTEQQYAGVFDWLNTHEAKPVVVWVDPHDDMSLMLPIFTHHFVLDSYWGMLELAPDSEIRERYLVSQYFNNPSTTTLETIPEMTLYLGRHDLPHEAKTIEREVKLCRVLFYWDKDKVCGTVPTPQSLLGEPFFDTMATALQTDIKPNIKSYLAKYHVQYIVKDTVLDPAYHPEALGAVKVYSDERYEIYKLQ